MENIDYSDENYSERGSPEIDENEIVDDRLRQAFSMAQETHQLTPVIKEELRLTILNRRMNAGMEDFPADYKEQPRERKLSHEEKAKKERRREQNRVAAQRCRMKKKEREGHFRKELQAAQLRNTAMASSVLQLRAEKEELQRILDEHKKVCLWSDFPNMQSAQTVESTQLPNHRTINDLDNSVLNTVVNFGNYNSQPTNLGTLATDHSICTVTSDYNRDAESPFLSCSESDFQDLGDMSPDFLYDENFNINEYQSNL